MPNQPMPNQRGIIAIAATVIVDTAWLYPVLGVFGTIFKQGGSFLPLPLVLALIALGVLVSRVAPFVVENDTGRASFQALLGLGVIYGAMSMVPVVDGAESGIDLLWGPHLIGGGFSGKAATGLIVGAIVAGFLWRRGVHIAVETHPQFRLVHTFRTGIVALAGAILFEQAVDVDVAATIMLVPFFTVSLVGLMFARLPLGAAWTRIAGLAAMVVVGGGLVIGLIGALFGGRGLEFLVSGLSQFLTGLIWLVTPVLEVIFTFFAWLIGEVEPPRRGRNSPPPFDMKHFEHFEPDSVPAYIEQTVHALKYPALLLAIYLLYRSLHWAYQAHTRRALAAVAVDRESIRGEANPTIDLLNLALGLLPDWLLPEPSQTGPRYPKDRPGISEVYALYFDLLVAAGKRGYDFVSSATPRERQHDLEHAVPGAPVARITDCFNAACYGNIATAPETLKQLRREFETATNIE
jgi:hypothetical protein